MPHAIEIVDDLMCVLDDEGNGCDAHIVRRDGASEAERKIDEWAAQYGIDPVPAKRELRDLIRRM